MSEELVDLKTKVEKRIGDEWNNYFTLETSDTREDIFSNADEIALKRAFALAIKKNIENFSEENLKKIYTERNIFGLLYADSKKNFNDIFSEYADKKVKDFFEIKAEKK